MIAELCALYDGCKQYYAAAMLRLTQPQVSALRRGRGDGFSVGRLLRLIASQGYNIEIHLKVLPRRYAKPRPTPSVTLVRYDHYDRPIGKLSPARAGAATSRTPWPRASALDRARRGHHGRHRQSGYGGTTETRARRSAIRGRGPDAASPARYRVADSPLIPELAAWFRDGMIARC